MKSEARDGESEPGGAGDRVAAPPAAPAPGTPVSRGTAPPAPAAGGSAATVCAGTTAAGAPAAGTVTADARGAAGSGGGTGRRSAAVPPRDCAPSWLLVSMTTNLTARH
ncbi:hypothetical protein [Streptomyces thermodiastaticus]|uniref:hypothetical protein n=1 Tax=Streptomyces thermodiastaticus TaxID=44061 RepID=UPI001F3ECE8E|nr:hypothetical protein [Streptomyces thermodiastaticus]MCE7549420.1 hypothetical protein [Streptomyces thermodiastaticus]